MYLWLVISIVWNLLTIMLLVAFRYLNAIQTMCPHILRYLTTAVITNRRRRQAHHHQLLKDLVKVIQQVWDLSIQWVVVYGIIKSFNFEVCISLQHLFYVRVKYLLLLLGLSMRPFLFVKDSRDLSMSTRIQIDSVMCTRSSCRGRNTGVSVTVKVKDCCIRKPRIIM